MTARPVHRAWQTLVGVAVLLLIVSCSREEEPADAFPVAVMPESHAEGPDAARVAEVQEVCDQLFVVGVDAAIDHQGVGYCLGPVVLTGEGFKTAAAEIGAAIGWHVSPVFSDEGIATFNQTAKECFDRAPSCPTTQVAIVVDGFVESAPSIQAPRFEADQVVISGPNMTQAESQWIAAQIRSREATGRAHPVQIRPVLFAPV